MLEDRDFPDSVGSADAGGGVGPQETYVTRPPVCRQLWGIEEPTPSVPRGKIVA